MKSAFKIASAQYDFETDAGAVLYGSGKLSTALDNANSRNISKFGKLLLSANEKDFKRLLEISENVFRDECGNIWDGGTYLSSEQAKFGTSSLRCESAWLATAPVTFGDDPFTISFWFRPDESKTDIWLFRAVGAKRSFGFYEGASHNFYFKYGTTSPGTTQKSGGGLTAKTWHHYELCYNGSGSLVEFRDGAKNQTVSITVAREPRRIILGPTPCYIDDFRILDGTCLHTAKFTVPTSASEMTADTISLLHFE